MGQPDLSEYPLCEFFIMGHLSRGDDPINFPSDQFPDLLGRYEKVFANALQVLGLSKEALRRRSEFNFDSGDAANLESGIAMLRAVEALRMLNFNNIQLITPMKGSSVADISCDKNDQKVCCEVKAITKHSNGRQGLFLEEQLYERVLGSLSKARCQLEASASVLQCTVTIFVSVVNWFDQSVYLNEENYQSIVNRLEKDRDQESLEGIDGVLFITKMGQDFLFLNERGKCID